MECCPLTLSRDSEESAPAEYPPEQPEADQLDDDGQNYGVEEAEMQAALEKELADTEAKMPQPATNGDAEMGGTDEPQARAKDEDEGSDAGSEDLEEESSDDDEEEDEEGEGDEDMEMGDGEQKPAQAQANGEKKPSQQVQQQPEVMVH